MKSLYDTPSFKEITTIANLTKFEKITSLRITPNYYAPDAKMIDIDLTNAKKLELVKALDNDYMKLPFETLASYRYKNVYYGATIENASDSMKTIDGKTEQEYIKGQPNKNIYHLEISYNKNHSGDYYEEMLEYIFTDDWVETMKWLRANTDVL
jgi:hypothetical protein